MTGLRDILPRASADFLARNALLSNRIEPKKKAAVTPLKTKGRQLVPRSRNLSTQTEAQFWQSLRSGLRRTFRFWKPALEAAKRARIARKGPKGQKWAYLCADCQKLFLRRQVQIDHIEPCGELTDYSHAGEFIRRLTAESPDDYAIRCKDCHQVKTDIERQRSNTPAIAPGPEPN